MMSYIILFQHETNALSGMLWRISIVLAISCGRSKRFECATLYMWTRTFSKTEEKIVVFKNIRMLVGRSLKHLVWLGTRPKFGFRRAADGSKPSRLTLFRTKKILKYPYPVQDKRQNERCLLFKQFIGNCNGENSLYSHCFCVLGVYT